MMNRFAMVVTVLAISGSACIAYGQLSREDLEAIARDRASVATWNADWQQDKKLTLLDTVPEKAPERYNAFSFTSASEGDVGELSPWRLRVLSVVGPEDVLLISENVKLPPLWLSKHPTRDLVDGQVVRLVGPIEACETKSYATASGASKTVRVFRFVTKERAAEIEAAAWAVRWKGHKRIWTDKTGNRSFEAVYDSDLGGGKIRLIREDGSQAIVSLSQLSDKDRKHALSLRDAAKPKPKPRPK